MRIITIPNYFEENIWYALINESLDLETPEVYGIDGRGKFLVGKNNTRTRSYISNDNGTAQQYKVNFNKASSKT